MGHERIGLHDSILDVGLKLAEGNPGAITVIARMLKEGKDIDPQAMNPILAVLGLDTLGIYGSRIWMLYKDVCGQDLEKTLAMLRAWQLGIIHETALHHAIDNMGNGIDVDDLLQKVKAELPDFGAKRVKA